jgi:hypothetical protein
MKYTLITKAGKLYTFYVLQVAELYQAIHGGTIVTADILSTVTVSTTV